jgi:hypothetical protein
MGGKQSTMNDTAEDGDGDCQRCFLFNAPFRSSDAIGSPLPETPVMKRNMRKQAMQDAANGDHNADSVFSSKYFGLEKEVFDQSSSKLDDPKEVHRAEVYEGKVSLNHGIRNQDYPVVVVTVVNVWFSSVSNLRAYLNLRACSCQFRTLRRYCIPSTNLWRF